MQASRYTDGFKDSFDGGRDQVETSGTRSKRDHRPERSEASLYRKHVSGVCFLLSPLRSATLFRYLQLRKCTGLSVERKNFWKKKA